MKKQRTGNRLAFGLILCLCLVSACGGAPPALSPIPEAETVEWPGGRPAKLVKCVVPTPRSWDGPGFREGFRVAEELGSTICLPDPVDWFAAEGKPAEEAKPAKDARWQKVLIEQHKLDVFIQMDPYKTRRGPIPELPSQIAKPSFADPTLRQAFIADAVQRVKLYDSKYVCLAMEINAYYEQNPGDFDNFVSLFKEARAEVKKIQPEALVFVSFQYEQLLGKFGGQGDLPKHDPHWELFKKFEPDIDAIGISSYPMEKFSPPTYGDPAGLPEDYYTRMAEHTKKPIVFAELGWPSDPAFGGSLDKQAGFLRRLPVLLKGLDVRLMNWNFLFDVKGYGPVFESMGLIDPKGQIKPAFAVWDGL